MKLIHLSDLHLGKRVNEYSMQEDQARLHRRLEQEIAKNRQLRAYADGLEYALEALGRQDVRVRIGGGEDGAYPGTV